jgi:predicted NBD/HSP70 family sugar kinase
MSGEKYMGLDVHQATISVAVMDCQGKLIMESILETKASTILEFLAACVELYRSPSKKGPGRHGYRICSSRMWPA